MISGVPNIVDENGNEIEQKKRIMKRWAENSEKKKASTFNQYTMESRCNNNEILVIIKTNTSNILSFILLKSEIERERERLSLMFHYWLASYWFFSSSAFSHLIIIIFVFNCIYFVVRFCYTNSPLKLSSIWKIIIT